MHKLLTLALIGFVITLSGCKTTPLSTKGEAYQALYQQQPRSIVVVPAINLSTAADAPELYLTTIAQPLSEAGFYVMSVPIVKQILNMQGVVDGAELRTADMSKFNLLFGADAVLFVTINSWDTNYYVTGGNVTVGASFELISTANSETLWLQERTVVHNTSGGSGNIFADIIATAISTAITDYVPIARTVNRNVIVDLPKGPYHPKYLKDQAEPVRVSVQK
ncbi:MAG: DUF799 family lipoprotein [Psychrobium sp.]|nr:DUF799 family lipoprotein [Psychrobium sp.]